MKMLLGIEVDVSEADDPIEACAKLTALVEFALTSGTIGTRPPSGCVVKSINVRLPDGSQKKVLVK